MVEAAAAVVAADYFKAQAGLYAPDSPMFAVGLRRLLAYNNNRTYSPLILNNEWPTLWRLILIISFTLIGTITNGFFVSSFFIEHPLKRLGNVYLASVGLADLIITTGVMPTAAVVMISRVWELSTVCYALQFLTQTSTYTYSLLFTMVALETYMRLCRSRACYKRFMSIPVAFVTFMLFAVSFAVSGTGVYLGMDYDYCTRETFGNYTFRLVTLLFLHGIPFLCTVIFLVFSSLMVRARARRDIQYKRSQQYDRDYSFINLNIFCYSCFVLAWLPYLVIVNKYPGTTDSSFYNCVWLGLSRSIITSFLYSGLNRNFRRAFSHLFYYCFCKSSMTVPYNNRHRRAFDYKMPIGDVRVHILHNTLASSPPRSSGARVSRDTYTLE